MSVITHTDHFFGWVELKILLISYFEIYKELLSAVPMPFGYEILAGFLLVPLYTLPIKYPSPLLHPSFWNQPFSHLL